MLSHLNFSFCPLHQLVVTPTNTQQLYLLLGVFKYFNYKGNSANSAYTLLEKNL